MFDISPDIFHETFIVSILVGERVIEKRVYKNCPIMLPNRVFYVIIVDFNMFDFYDHWVWIDAFFASIDCRTRVLNRRGGETLFLEVVLSLV